MVTMIAALPLTASAEVVTSLSPDTIYTADQLFSSTYSFTSTDWDVTNSTYTSNYENLGEPFGALSDFSSTYTKWVYASELTNTLNITTDGNYTFMLLMREYNTRGYTLTITDESNDSNTQTLDLISGSATTTIIAKYSTSSIAIVQNTVSLSAGTYALTFTPTSSMSQYFTALKIVESSKSVGTVYTAAELSATVTYFNSSGSYTFTKDNYKNGYTALGSPFGDADSELTVENYPSYASDANAVTTLAYSIETAGTYRFTVLSREYTNLYPTITLDDNDSVVYGAPATVSDTTYLNPEKFGTAPDGNGFTFLQLDFYLEAGNHTISLGRATNIDGSTQQGIRGVIAVVLEEVSVGDVQVYDALSMNKVVNSDNSAEVPSWYAFSASNVTEEYNRDYAWIFGTESELSTANSYGYLGGTGTSRRGSLSREITIPSDGSYTFYALVVNSQSADYYFALDDTSIYANVTSTLGDNSMYVLYSDAVTLSEGMHTFRYASTVSSAPNLVAMAVVRNPGFGENATDSGVYTVDGTTYGVIRYLQLYSGSDSDELSEYGFYFISAEDGSILTDKIYNTGSLGSEYGGFYGDLYGIPEGNCSSSYTYYAKPYVIISSDEDTVLYGSSIGGYVNSGNSIEYTEPSSGTTE